MEIAHDVKRAWLPVEVYPISAGIKGGLAGSVAMAVLAMLYGILSQRQHLVSDQSPGRRLFPGRYDSHHGRNCGVSSARFSDCHSDSPDHVPAGRVALRRDVADAAAAADFAGRLHRARPVVRR